MAKYVRLGDGNTLLYGITYLRGCPELERSKIASFCDFFRRERKKRSC